MVADAVSRIILGDLSCVENKHEYNFYSVTQSADFTTAFCTR